MTPLLAASRLGYSVGAKALVDEVTLRLEAGQMTIVVGPNGAGKSTLMKLLAGELKAQKGEVCLLGAPLSSLPPWRLACHRAVMSQTSRLTFPFAVHDVVRFGLSGVGRAMRRAEADRLVETCLASVDTGHLARRDYQTLSGGEQQRVQFARALCQLEAGRGIEPAQLLFLDEPVASLDLNHQLALLDIARALADRRGVAVLAILHDLNLAAAYADQLVLMRNGRAVALGRPAEVLTEQRVSEVFGLTLANPKARPLLSFLSAAV